MEACHTFKGLITVKQIKSRHDSFAKDGSMSNMYGLHRMDCKAIHGSHVF